MDPRISELELPLRHTAWYFETVMNHPASTFSRSKLNVVTRGPVKNSVGTGSIIKTEHRAIIVTYRGVM